MERTGSGFQQINISKWWNEINLWGRGKPDSLPNNYNGKLTIKVTAVVRFSHQLLSFWQTWCYPEYGAVY